MEFQDGLTHQEHRLDTLITVAANRFARQKGKRHGRVKMESRPVKAVYQLLKPMTKLNEASWEMILKAVEKVGKQKVYDALLRQHKVYENMAAELWSDSNTYADARRLDEILLRQDMTLIKLRNL